MTRWQTPEEILRKFYVTDPRDIDLEVIAFDCGAEIQEASLKGCAAHVIGAGDRAVITVDANSPPGRKRFSIAHELGHWMNHRGKAMACVARDLLKPWSALDPEAVANAFAADLLLPEYLFRPRVEGRPISFKTVAEMAEVFQVSRSAAALRLVQFGSYDAMLLCYDKDGRREWFRGSRRVDGVLWPAKILSKDSDAYDILRGGQGSGRPIKVDADDWIDHPRARDYEIREHSVPYGDGVLTLLWWEDASMVEELGG
jgi:hypothetical protein